MVKSKADEVLRGIERMAEREFLPILGPHKGRVLQEVIRKVKPKRILEVGALIGYSAILMGKVLGSDAHIITIEIHSDEAAAAKDNIRKVGIKPAVDVLVGDAIEILPKLEGPFDLVFVDADKTECIDYIKLVEDKLHKESVVVADNAGVFADEMREYLDYVRNSGKYDSRYVPVGEDGLEVSTRIQP